MRQHCCRESLQLWLLCTVLSRSSAAARFKDRGLFVASRGQDANSGRCTATTIASHGDSIRRSPQRRRSLMIRGGAADEEEGIDEGLYSRQLYVMGRSAMAKLSKADVLISGLRYVLHAAPL